MLSTQLHAAGDEKPEAITGRMAVKFGKGITNIATSVVEIPKQTAVMTRDMGPIGFVVGPFSGLLMTGYRAFIGASEALFFMVPAPGYYDDMMDPEFVWAGWGPQPKTSMVASDNPDDHP